MLSLSQIKTRLAWESQTLKDRLDRVSVTPAPNREQEIKRIERRLSLVSGARTLAREIAQLRRAMPFLKVTDRKSARAILDDMMRRARVFRRELEL